MDVVVVAVIVDDGKVVVEMETVSFVLGISLPLDTLASTFVADSNLWTKKHLPFQ